MRIVGNGNGSLERDDAMRWVLLLTFCASFVLSIILVLVVRKLARRRGFMDHPGGRKAHPNAVPLGGGIAIFFASAVPVFGAGMLSRLWAASPSLFPVPEVLRENVLLAAGQFPVLMGVLAGGLAVAALGLWDDAKGLSPTAKLFAQFVIAVAVAMIPAVRITLFIDVAWVHVLVTAVWIVLLINAFNLLDNMDGQSGLVAFLTGGVLLVLALQTGQNFIAGMLLALLGAVLGFLLFNFPPASVFMGDTGSMYVGYVLAVSTTLATFLTNEQVNPLFPVLVPLVIFAVPLYDTLSVLAIRLHTGRPLMEGDRNHFAHRLLRLGLNARMVLLVVGLMVLATAPGATIPYGSSTWCVFVPAVQAGAVVCVIIILEIASARLQGEGMPE
ncbi:MAG: MraY family glycosyltransferase [Candidatus Brocadiaceae bacterium]|jgi:UDP-GlcNAc:undecaprenyl-phosphate GlcNAc-1-phosphate transferase